MTTNINPQIDNSWKEILKEEFEQEYFKQLKSFLLEEKKKYTIYPPGNCIFKAFNSTPFNRVKVVILGQDPYHGAGQAHGLCFSVPDDIKPPPSLKNIFKEIADNTGETFSGKGNLEKWAQQGVLLLNATLTVRASVAGSHQKKGWETFTNAVIKAISEKSENVVFLLWGNYAREKKHLIDTSKHLVLEAAHPSPFSADKGFFGCKHFSKCNAYLELHKKNPIEWSV